MLEWQESLIQGLAQAESEEQLFALLAAAARTLGFDYCAHGLRVPLPVSNPRVFMVNNYPEEWQKQYVREQYITIDPTVAHGMRSLMPLVWSQEVFSDCRSFWEEARSHGLRNGWAQSCHDARGNAGLLTLARSHDDISRDELRAHSLQMSWLAHAVHEGMVRLVAGRLVPDADKELSARETEVLRWTADGKTSADVSDIMHISERTVNFHLNNAMAKLGVCNKTALAVKATVLGLL